MRNEAFEIKIPGLDGSDHFAVDRSVGLELVWELVRLNEFSGAPSRFQSMFAFESLAEAQQCQVLDGGDGTIWEVETDLPGFRADMSLLHTHPKMDSALQMARIYWSQSEDYDRSNLPPECGPPVWEILLAAPVHVVRLATDVV
ncbi:DUF2441 domain-containing protein [Nocardia noduli]|uniref:DUF2441 domain-containing protein n=1 Tax=Nocardia noduli TaxID=2815722 RepID=UPI001C236B07|nr:DUF2441 domain-containing protein [Nocardia noduli]